MKQKKGIPFINILQFNRLKHRFIFFSIFFLIISAENIIQAERPCLNERPVLLVIGTRPEAIKMAPVYYALKKLGIPALVCSTGQHAELLTDALKLFDIKPDYDLAIMKQNQDLFYLTTALLMKLKDVFVESNPTLVIVQGDTTSAMAGALAAFYLKIPVAHVEAGLRTGNIYMPFPEEVNRCIISREATYNFAPTQQAKENLLKEGISPATIYLTGNTIVDALFSVKEKIDSGLIKVSDDLRTIVVQAKQKQAKIMLLTAHRRESFDGGLEHIFNAVKQSLKQNKNLFIVYPVHPNPAIHRMLSKAGFENMENIKIIKPLTYSDMIYLMVECNGIATDSGGIQEEGVSLGKQVLILRNETERAEGIATGLAELIGTDEDKIQQGILRILSSQSNHAEYCSVYGDGKASARIATIIKENLYS